MKSILVLESDECRMETVNNEYVCGPIWLSKGERFRPTGAYIYLELRYQELVIQHKKTKKHLKEINLVIKEKEREKQKGKSDSENNDGTDEEQNSSNEDTNNEKSKIKDKLSGKDKTILSMTIKELKEFRKVRKIFQ